MYLNYTLFLKNIKYIDMPENKDQIEALKNNLQRLKISATARYKKMDRVPIGLS